MKKILLLTFFLLLFSQSFSGCPCSERNKITCHSASCCDDGNPCTSDECANPGTTDSKCYHFNLNNGVECGEFSECFDGACVFLGCKSDKDCEDNLFCNTESGKCVGKVTWVEGTGDDIPTPVTGNVVRTAPSLFGDFIQGIIDFLLNIIPSLT